MEDKVEEIYRKFSTLEEDIKNSKKQINIRFIILSILFMLFAIYLTYEAFSYKDEAEYLLHMGLGMCILLYFQRVYSIRELNSKYKQSVVPELLSLINSNLTYTTQAGHTEDEFKKAEVYDDRIDKYSSSDLIQGIIGKTSMKISYILVENKGNYNNIVAYVPAYTGTLVTLDFNKYFTGKTKIYTMVF